MVKVKICGLSRLEDIDAVNEVLPDYIGFVFAKSKRQVDRDTAARLKERLDFRIKAVGVFVNEDMESIVRLCADNVIDMVQLHGEEGKEYTTELKERVSKPIVKGVRVKSVEDIVLAEELACDYLLLDAYHEGQHGGSGKAFDWEMIPKGKKPFFMAGGIDLGNVGRAMEWKPYCIDVSSGVETDGYKDSAKIREFVGKIREYNRNLLR